MGKVSTSVVFKTYQPQQSVLFPSSLDEFIGEHELVRVVNTVVDSMDVSSLMNLYQGGGTSAYHPRMLLKVLLYGYCVKIYTGRKIARALERDIHFMWLAAKCRPDFRTINLFRSSKAKDAIQTLFAQLLLFLMEHEYIKMEDYFCDGSTFVADGNKHKMTWKKNAERYKEQVKEKCKALFAEIDQLNQEEDKQYGDKNLEECGGGKPITKEVITEQVAKLNEELKTITDKKKARKVRSISKKLEEAAEKIQQYDDQIETAGNRSGYNKTDEDASAMMMKNKVEVLPAYNIMAGSENQFITGISVHQNPNDATCLPDHLKAIGEQQPKAPENVIADSIFGTHQNYELLEQKGMNNYMKFPTFHAEQTQGFQKNPYLKENFKYDALTDIFTCPGNRQLVYTHHSSKTHPKTGFQTQLKHYACTDCGGCPFFEQCCKAEEGKNRTIQIDEKLEIYKQQARENLHSDQGKEFRRQRSIEIETCFGDIKHNMGFRRFHLRGLEKVGLEIKLVAMAHNLRKMLLVKQKQAA